MFSLHLNARLSTLLFTFPAVELYCTSANIFLSYSYEIKRKNTSKYFPNPAWKKKEQPEKNRTYLYYLWGEKRKFIFVASNKMNFPESTEKFSLFSPFISLPPLFFCLSLFFLFLCLSTHHHVRLADVIFLCTS